MADVHKTIEEVGTGNNFNADSAKKVGRWGKYRLKVNLKAFLYPNEYLSMIKLASEASGASGLQTSTLTILANTGARYNEARHIKLEDIDFERNSLILKVTKVRAAKGEARANPRHIPISSKFSKYLRSLATKHKLSPNSYFPMLSQAAANATIKRLALAIGRKDYQDFSPHNIRKTFECWLIAIGVDGFKVAKHLGHTAAVAMNDYISPDVFTYNDKVAIREILGDLYDYHERGRF